MNPRGGKIHLVVIAVEERRIPQGKELANR